MTDINWKFEAQKNAESAGNLKMQLAFRLDDIKTRIDTMSEEAKKSENFDTQICFMNRISLLKEERAWIERVLYGKEKENG